MVFVVVSRIALILTLALAGACSSPKPMGVADGGSDPDARSISTVDADGGVFVCMVMPPTACPNPPVRFDSVQPIINTWCLACHNGESPDGPWPLRDYEHVASWADVVRSSVLDCSMPPPNAGLPPMPTEDRVTILKWILCGFPP
jgi:hypothetical protein